MGRARASPGLLEQLHPPQFPLHLKTVRAATTPLVVFPGFGILFAAT
jgi:hypothetical protein